MTENPDKFIPCNPYKVSEKDKRTKNICCGIRMQPAELECYLDKIFFTPDETIHIKCNVRKSQGTPKIKEITCKLI